MLNNVHGLLFTQSNIYNLRELTEPRCLSSIPFGGRFRMIDFMLSNLVNAGVSDVGVLLLAKYKSLLDHLGSGKDWDLARHSGGTQDQDFFALHLHTIFTHGAVQSGHIGVISLIACLGPYQSIHRSDILCQRIDVRQIRDHITFIRNRHI